MSGTAVRCIFLVWPGVPDSTLTLMYHLGSVLNGIPSIVVTAAPPAVSAAWFPADERVTATSISQMLNNVGTGLSFLLASILVKVGARVTCPVTTTAVTRHLRHVTSPLLPRVTCHLSCAPLLQKLLGIHPPPVCSSVPFCRCFLICTPQEPRLRGGHTTNTTCRGHGTIHSSHLNISALVTNSSSSTTQQELRADIQHYLIVLTVPAALLCLASLLYFPSR